MKRPSIIKKQSDFALSLLFLGLGFFLAFNKGITGEALNALGGFWARPSTYIRMLGWGLIIFSVVLLLTSINWTKGSDVQKLRLDIGFEAAVTAGILVIYCAVLPIITFFPATFLLVFSTNLLFKRKEEQRADETDSGQMPAKSGNSSIFTLKSILVSVLYSVCITLAAWVVFTQFLKTILP